MLKSPKLGCQIFRVVIWHLFFGDLSQSEKLSEIKLPLAEKYQL